MLPVEVPAGAVPAELWVGYDPEVIETARASGDEEDFARTLFVHPWHSVEEIKSILSTSRSWTQESSIGRALTFAAESYLYRFGEFARAEHQLEHRLEEQVLDLQGDLQLVLGLILVDVGIDDDVEAGEVAKEADGFLERLRSLASSKRYDTMNGLLTTG